MSKRRYYCVVCPLVRYILFFREYDMEHNHMLKLVWNKLVWDLSVTGLCHALMTLCLKRASPVEDILNPRLWSAGGGSWLLSLSWPWVPSRANSRHPHQRALCRQPGYKVTVACHCFYYHFRVSIAPPLPCINKSLATVFIIIFVFPSPRPL